ncbi:MAG: ferritin-like domain-containing protein [Spirochaetes bacterium]|nr:ferritin-like domain-containing protein [Spirochaetota bacterium]
MARVKLDLTRDRELFAFIFARFIDGEFTGLKEGYALNRAPTLEAADFLARQIRDEIRHARMYRRLYEKLGLKNRAPRSSPLMSAILTPVTGRLWAEHCFLDKAIGERWVLYLMEWLSDSVADRLVVNNLKAIAKDEQTHIAFGEAETRCYATSPWRRYYLWGLFLRVDVALTILFRLTHRFFKKRYGSAAAKLLDDFFIVTRGQVAEDIADLLQVKNRRSWLQLVVCQLVFIVRYPFVGWWRNPRQNF